MNKKQLMILAVVYLSPIVLMAFNDAYVLLTAPLLYERLARFLAMFYMCLAMLIGPLMDLLKGVK
jgi:hypothetical protein